jgi:hypothetical protein
MPNTTPVALTVHVKVTAASALGMGANRQPRTTRKADLMATLTGGVIPATKIVSSMRT